MVKIRQSRPDDGTRIIEIWQKAVDATHDFLIAADRAAIGELVRTFLQSAPLWLAVDPHDHPLGFMLVDDGQMEALFVDPAHHGRGVGKALVQHGLALHPALKTDVNEQNGRALRFYEHLGFQRIGRSPLDGQGRPYPLIHLEHRG